MEQSQIFQGNKRKMKKLSRCFLREIRIENMEDNKKRMLDSILDRERKSINIDRLIVKKDNKLELILEKEEILRERTNILGELQIQ